MNVVLFIFMKIIKKSCRKYKRNTYLIKICKSDKDITAAHGLSISQIVIVYTKEPGIYLVEFDLI